MIVLGLRKDMWDGMLYRYASHGYIKARRIQIPSSIHRPSVLSVCHFQPEFGYDAVRLFDGTKKYLRRVNENICYHCYGVDIRIDTRSGCLICSRCGNILRDRMMEMDLTSTSSFPSDPILPRQYRDNVIKRVNHFKYWIQRIQGSETHRMSRSDIDEIKTYLSLHPGIPITFERIRKALKALNKRRFYNNTYYIMKELTGEAYVSLNRNHEQLLLLLFRKIQASYADVRSHRVNMLSYSFLIKKFCEILGWDDIALQLPTLKSRDKLREQDIIWKQICHHVGLPYYSSL